MITLDFMDHGSADIMKKLLLLGGSAQQITAVEAAKRLGYTTILCDYIPDNPGRFHADRFYPVSTTDMQAVLHVAEKENIDGILAYASDPAAPTAAYVAEKLGLPGNPFSSVNTLCSKDLFREFLKNNGFNTPVFKAYSSAAGAKSDLKNGYFRFPVIVKPVDSSGSKGVSIIKETDDTGNKPEHAMSFSRAGRIIIEEYITQNGYQVAGDALSVNGRLVFRYFGNDHFNPECPNPFVPVAASFPYNMPDTVQHKIHDEVQRLISLLHMGTCTYNLDLRIDSGLNVWFLEVAPREGGNYIPQVIQHATGENLVEYSVLAAMGEKIKESGFGKPEGFFSYYAVHSLRSGILKEISIDADVVKNNIIENHIIKKPGDSINAFEGANSTLGCLVMKFGSMNQMLDMMDNSGNWIRVLTE